MALDICMNTRYQSKIQKTLLQNSFENKLSERSISKPTTTTVGLKLTDKQAQISLFFDIYFSPKYNITQGNITLHLCLQILTWF